ncbi:MAG: hypothetical protein GY694_04240 [Gammaproteobacteria bacterium]|nr:hypothetical protein [Gammaproteobacteria bacterium]
MDTRFNIVYTGLQEGVTVEEFTDKFCQKFGVSEKKAYQIASSTSDVVVKKNLEEAKVKKYSPAFESCGAVVRVDEIVNEPAGLSLEPMVEKNKPTEGGASQSPDDAENASSGCPKCGSENIEGDECLDCGIFISKYLARHKNSSVQYEEVEDSLSEESVPSIDPTSSDSNESDRNPYATPEASLAQEIITKEGQGSLEGGVNGDYDFSIGEIFSEAWEKTKGVKGTFLLSWLFYGLVAFAINFVFGFFGPDPEALINQGRMSEGMFWAITPSLISIPLLYPILAGIVLLGIHRAVEADINATSVLSHYSKLIPLTLLTILSGLLTMIGFTLLVLPGIYLAIAYMMSMALMIDRNMGAWEAMETSRKAVTKHWFKIFLLYFVLGLIMMVASIPMLIGLIWAIPFASILHGVLYKRMFGVESVD